MLKSKLSDGIFVQIDDDEVLQDVVVRTGNKKYDRAQMKFASNQITNNTIKLLNDILEDISIQFSCTKDKKIIVTDYNDCTLIKVNGNMPNLRVSQKRSNIIIYTKNNQSNIAMKMVNSIILNLCTKLNIDNTDMATKNFNRKIDFSSKYPNFELLNFQQDLESNI